MRKITFASSLLFLLSAFWPSGLAAGAPEKKDVAELEGYKPQLVLGQASELRAYGKNLSVQSVEIAPAEGITVGEIKEGAPNPLRGAQLEKNVKVWTVPVTVSQTAQVGERSVVFVTPKGRSQAKAFAVVTHRPAITAFEIVSAASADAKIQAKITFADEAGDMGPEPRVMWMVRCGRNVILSFSHLTLPELTQKTGVIENTFSQTGATARGPCALEVSVSDSKGNESPDWVGAVMFK